MNKSELEELIQVQKDTKFLKKSYNSLKKNYENQYIAIKNGDIIANNKNIEAVIKEIKAKKFNPATIPIEFIHPKDILLIL